MMRDQKEEGLIQSAALLANGEPAWELRKSGSFHLGKTEIPPSPAGTFPANGAPADQLQFLSALIPTATLPAGGPEDRECMPSKCPHCQADEIGRDDCLPGDPAP